MPLIRDFIAEHEQVFNLGEDALRAMNRDDLDTARRLLQDMATELETHWQGEENGLFRVMAREEELFAEHIEPLIAEHRDLAGLLATLDIATPEGKQVFHDAIEDLYAHVRKEEDGIFPASLTSLNGDEWDVAIDAWRAAHSR